MPAWQADLLQRIPGFVWEPAVGAWWVKLELLRAFLEREGRVPRYRSSDAGERELAAWVHKQRTITFDRAGFGPIASLRSAACRSRLCRRAGQRRIVVQTGNTYRGRCSILG